jgi:hypothetical protein
VLLFGVGRTNVTARKVTFLARDTLGELLVKPE